MKRPWLHRSDLPFALLFILLAAVPGYMVYMIRHNKLPDYVHENGGAVQMIQHLPGRPGNMYARSNRSYVLLASSSKIPGCFADPSLMSESQLGEVSCLLGDIFNMEPEEIYCNLSVRGDRRFTWVKKTITYQEAEQCRALGIRGIGIQYRWQRHYPCKSVAGTIIGARRLDNEPVCGLEQSFHQAIKASDGMKVYRADAGRRPFQIDYSKSEKPVDGNSIYLTIDVNIQEYLQKAIQESVETHDAEWGGGIVIEPKTGDILAMASCPTFDPNLYGSTPIDHMTNRVISYPVEPGSVFKPLIAASAVQDGKVSWDTRIFCENGVYHAHRGGRISDHGHRYDYLSVRDGVVFSSNILMAKLGEKLGNARLYELVRAWGFGTATEISLPAESPGIVRPKSRWDGYSLRRVPFGQEISATILQMAMAFAAVANDGILMKPRLVRNVVDSSGREILSCKPQRIRQVLSAEVARGARHVMKDVVERGTGKKCQLELWSSWGKTGTAQIAGDGGYVDGAYTGSFIGGAPVDNPAIICLISIYRPDRNKGYYGSKVAAPYVKAVLENTLGYLRVPSDKNEGVLVSGNR